MEVLDKGFIVTKSGGTYCSSTAIRTAMRSPGFGIRAVPGELLMMRPLGCRTIPDNVIATQKALGRQVAVGLFQRLPRGLLIEALMDPNPL